MKEIVEENIFKQAERIFEVMKFSSKEHEAMVHTHVVANLIRSVKAQQRYGKAVFDAKKTRLFKFTNALRSSRNQEEFFKFLRVEFPGKSDAFLIRLITQYQEQLLGAIQYPFPLDIPVSKTKEEKEAKKSDDELRDMAIRGLTEQVSRLSDKIAEIEKHTKGLENLMIDHKHNQNGKSYIECIIVKEKP